MDYTYTTVQPSSEKVPSLRERLSKLFSRSGGNNAASVPKSKRIGTYIFVLIITVAVIGSIRLALIRRPAVNGLSTTQTAQDDAQTVAVNREFSIPVYDKDKKIANPIRYILTDSQLTRQIIIKGQRATAVKGRSFLIINLKLVNDFNQSLFLNTRNYVRIQPAGATDKLAPEIHNDTVEVQPLSTKLTRIGLPVGETDKQFTLFVGEIDGEKQEISLSF